MAYNFDKTVHCVVEFGVVFGANSGTTYPQVSVESTADATFPGGHYLFIRMSPTAGIKVPCDGIKPPSVTDCTIITAGTNQGPLTVADSTHRTFVRGKELSAAPGTSAMVVHRKNADGTQADFLLYSDAAHANLVVPLGNKIPPNVGY